MKEEGPSALEPYRVLDLTDGGALLCGKILADLGADVIKVEPPGGDPARRMGPFCGKTCHPEGSLLWAAYNTGKRSITLDLASGEGSARLLELADGADFLLESFVPGHMEALGLGYAALERRNPRLVVASITPFGQTGPRCRWKGPDLVTWALGGYMWMTGDPERAPLRISQPPQAFFHAGAIGAVGCLMALHHRAATGRGQHVDVSAQQCPSWMLTNSYAYWDLAGQILKRGGALRHFGSVTLQTLWRARDGYVTFMFSGGAIGAKGQRRIVDLMEKEGMAPDWLKEIRWDQVDAFSANQEELDRISTAFARFFASKTKAQLLEEAVKGGIMAAPVNTVADVLRDVQLRDRNYWIKIHDPRLKTSLELPGPPAKMSLTPWQVKGPAPRIGEHNEQMYGGKPWRQRGRVEYRVPDGSSGTGQRRPLTGVKVLDFTTTVLGPSTTRYLADHGATVVRVESMAHPETLRIASPYAGGVSGVNRSGYFATHNAGKLSLSLNMTKPGAGRVVERLIRWADVLVESFAPGVMTRWGLDYGRVRTIRPDIVMASTCLQGQTGPHSPHRGYGQMVSAMGGWFELTGWPDGEPVGPYSAYSDFVDWNYLLVSILAALDHRRRTGKGQYIDQSQLESALHFLAPALLDYQADGKVATRMGNRDPDAAPHGAYRCLGDDRWCAIAVTSPEEWEAFCRVLQDREWTRDPRFQTASGRKRNEEELDRLVEGWTRGLEAEKVMERLQGAGVPAGVVQDARDLFGDPQLRHRGHFAALDHPEIGRYHIATSAFHLSKCPNRPTGPAPLFGEHNERVLKGFLNMDDEEIGELIAEGALE